MSIRQIGEQDIADCVEVIRVSFMTIAKIRISRLNQQFYRR